jgi:hypothetical protein
MTKSRDDKDDKQTSHDPSRRKFLKGVGIAGAGAAVVDKLWIDVEAKETQADTSQSMSGSVKVTLDINGTKRTAQVEPRTTLLNTLRNHVEPAVTGPSSSVMREPAARVLFCSTASQSTRAWSLR